MVCFSLHRNAGSRFLFFSYRSFHYSCADRHRHILISYTFFVFNGLRNNKLIFLDTILKYLKGFFMSSLSPTAQNGPPSEKVWTSIAPYIAPPVAASAAIVPSFYGFVAKSAKQLGEPIPRMTIREALL